MCENRLTKTSLKSWLNRSIWHLKSIIQGSAGRAVLLDTSSTPPSLTCGASEVYLSSDDEEANMQMFSAHSLCWIKGSWIRSPCLLLASIHLVDTLLTLTLEQQLKSSI